MMEIPVNQLPPGDPHLVNAIVGQLKSKGIFDKFRKECLADVDTKPAYLNLRQRVDGQVKKFLGKQTWKSDMNKNQLRDSVRKNIQESHILDSGIDAIINQVVNPKIQPLILPLVEETVYDFLQIERPKREVLEHALPPVQPPVYEQPTPYGAGEVPIPGPPQPFHHLPYYEPSIPMYKPEPSTVPQPIGHLPKIEESFVAAAEPETSMDSKAADESKLSTVDDSKLSTLQSSQDVVSMETDAISSEEDNILARCSPPSSTVELRRASDVNVKVDEDNAVDSFEGARKEADSVAESVEKLTIKDENTKSQTGNLSEMVETSKEGLQKSLDSISTNSSGLSMSPKPKEFEDIEQKHTADSQEGFKEVDDVRSSQSTPLNDEKNSLPEPVSSEENWDMPMSSNDGMSFEKAPEPVYSCGKEALKFIGGASPVSSESQDSLNAQRPPSPQTFKTGPPKSPKSEGELTSSSDDAPTTSGAPLSQSGTSKISDETRSTEVKTEKEEHKPSMLSTPSKYESQKDYHESKHKDHEKHRHHDSDRDKSRHRSEKKHSSDRDRKKHSKSSTDDHSSYRSDKHRRRDHDDDKDRHRSRDHHSSSKYKSSSGKSSESKDNRGRSHDKSDSHRSHSKSHSSHKSDSRSSTHSSKSSHPHSKKDLSKELNKCSENESSVAQTSKDSSSSKEKDFGKTDMEGSKSDKGTPSIRKESTDKHKQVSGNSKDNGKPKSVRILKEDNIFEMHLSNLKKNVVLPKPNEKKINKDNRNMKSLELKQKSESDIKLSVHEEIKNENATKDSKKSDDKISLKEDKSKVNVDSISKSQDVKNAKNNLNKVKDEKKISITKTENKISINETDNKSLASSEKRNQITQKKILITDTEKMSVTDNEKNRAIKTPKDKPKKKSPIKDNPIKKVNKLKENMDEGNNITITGLSKLERECQKLKSITPKKVTKSKLKIEISSDSDSSDEDAPLALKKVTIPLFGTKNKTPTPVRIPKSISKKAKSVALISDSDSSSDDSIQLSCANMFDSSADESDFEGFSVLPKKKSPLKRKHSGKGSSFAASKLLKTSPTQTKVSSLAVPKGRKTLPVNKVKTTKPRKSQLVVLCDSDSSDMEVSLVNYCQRPNDPFLEVSPIVVSNDFEGFEEDNGFIGFSSEQNRKLKDYLMKHSGESSVSLDDFISSASDFDMSDDDNLTVFTKITPRNDKEILTTDSEADGVVKSSISDALNTLESSSALACRVQVSPLKYSTLTRTSESDSRKPLKKRKLSSSMCSNSSEISKETSSDKTPLTEFVVKDQRMDSYSLPTPEEDRSSGKEYEVDLSGRGTSYSPLSPVSEESADDLKTKILKTNNIGTESLEAKSIGTS